MDISEKLLERRLTDSVYRKGGKALKLTSPGWAGAPDRLVLLPGGRAVFVELKAPGQKPRPLQAKRARELQALGFGCYTVSSLVELDEFLSEVASV